MTQFEVPRGGEQLDDDDRYATWDAPYVLGSLSDDERREYEAHLQTCPRCRAAVAELSGIPALLGKLDAADVAALDEEQEHPAATADAGFAARQLCARGAGVPAG